MKTILQDVLVLDAPEAQHTSIGQSTATQVSNVVLRLKPGQADQVAFASTNGTLWLSLRPQTGGTGTAPNIVTVESLLLGVKPMTILHALGGKR